MIAVDGHRYGLVAGAVEDVIVGHAAAPAATLAPEWARAAAGMIVAGDALLPCLDPERFVALPAT